MEENTNIERIEAYYHRTMPAEDRIQFEKELEANTALRQLYKEHVYMLDGMQGMKLEAFEKSIGDQKGNIPSLETSWLKRNRLVVSIAALIIIVVGLNWFFAKKNETVSIAREYYSAPFAEINRSELTTNTVFNNGMTAFSQQKWKEAIDAFDQVDPQDSSYQLSLYYTAHAYAGLQDFENSLAGFTDALLRNSEFKQQAEWNALLMRMMLNRPKKEIIDDLSMIANQPDHFYTGRAKNILERINK